MTPSSKSGIIRGVTFRVMTEAVSCLRLYTRRAVGIAAAVEMAPYDMHGLEGRQAAAWKSRVIGKHGVQRTDVPKLYSPFPRQW